MATLRLVGEKRLSSHLIGSVASLTKERATTDPWSISEGTDHPIKAYLLALYIDLGSGSRIPVRQKVRDARHGGTIWWNGQR
jgi:hypothetical protein